MALGDKILNTGASLFNSVEETSAPTQMDHLKVRAYLYKFTPSVAPAGKKPLQQFTDTLTKSGALKELESFNARLLNDLKDTQTIVQGLDFPETIPIKRKKAMEALTSLLSKVSEPYPRELVVTNVTKSPKASGQVQQTSPERIPFEGGGATKDPTGNPLGNFGIDLFSQTKYLRDVLAGKHSQNPVADRDIARNILAFLAHAIQYIQSGTNTYRIADKKVRQESTALRENLKQYQVSRFVYDLNTKYLSRFNLSKYLSRYETNYQLGNVSAVGTNNGDALFFNSIVPLAELRNDFTSTESARRPFLFPKESGDYVGYANGQRIDEPSLPSLDPITGEPISSISVDELITNMAMAQTLEDNGDGDLAAYATDVLRVEIAMRLRGIFDPQKKRALLNFFRTGNAADLQRVLKKGVVLENPDGNLSKQLDILKSLSDEGKDGILISDLIQKYDFITIYIYKQPISPDVIEGHLEGIDPYFFDKESLFMHTPANLLTSSLGDHRYVATYSPEFNGFINDITLAENVGTVNHVRVSFMGSMGLLGATRRIYNSTIFQGSVFDAAEVMDRDVLSLYENIFMDKDPLQILTTLLDSTYLLRAALPKTGKAVTVDPEEEKAIRAEVARAFSPENIELYGVGASEKKQQILEKKLAQAQQRAEKKVRSSSADFFKVDGQIVSFFDILSLRAFNQFGEKIGSVAKGPIHLFNMTSFLYANVMRSRRFNVRVPSREAVNKLSLDAGGSLAVGGLLPYDLQPSGQVKGAFNPFSPTSKVTTYRKQGDGSGGSVLEINPLLDVTGSDKAFAPYFKYLTGSLGTFVTDLKTGFEIMNDVVGVCYLELFETPGGRFIFRTPQYNNNNPIFKNLFAAGTTTTKKDASALTTNKNNAIVLTEMDTEADSEANMLTSDDIIQISASYEQKQAQNLVSKQSIGYGADLIGQPIEQLQYFYSNGKMISQYGLRMGKSVLNPNVRFVSKDKLAADNTGVTDESYMDGVFHYCRFFLEYSNIGNFTGTVTAVGSPRVVVGRTYYDIENQKFGYIESVSKSLDVGGTYTTTFTLVAVRDAVYGKKEAGEVDARPTFRTIPLMESFVPKFKKGLPEVKPKLSAQPSTAGSIEGLTGIVSAEVLADALRGTVPPRGRGGAPVAVTIDKINITAPIYPRLPGVRR